MMLAPPLKSRKDMYCMNWSSQEPHEEYVVITHNLQVNKLHQDSGNILSKSHTNKPDKSNDKIEVHVSVSFCHTDMCAYTVETK